MSMMSKVVLVITSDLLNFSVTKVWVNIYLYDFRVRVWYHGGVSELQ
jgi:hypothetical protein